MGAKKDGAVNAIRKVMGDDSKNPYEKFKRIESDLNLRRMEFRGHKLGPDGIEKLADAYKKLNNEQKATILRDFGEYLSIMVENGLKPAGKGLSWDVFCEFLEGYIIANDGGRVEMLQIVYKNGGPFKEVIDEYYEKRAADNQTSLPDYVYARAIITKDPSLLKTAYQLHEEASEYDGWDKNVRLLLLGAMLAEVQQNEEH